MLSLSTNWLLYIIIINNLDIVLLIVNKTIEIRIRYR